MSRSLCSVVTMPSRAVRRSKRCDTESGTNGVHGQHYRDASAGQHVHHDRPVANVVPLTNLGRDEVDLWGSLRRPLDASRVGVP
jgi:hypothetical protein